MAFKRPCELTAHGVIHSDDRPHKCTFEGCTMAFKRRSYLDLHTFRHSGERPFKCTFDECESEFATAAECRIHSIRHTGKRPFVCSFDQCEKVFGHRSSLNKHVRAHLNERRYECSFDGCDSAFLHLRQLDHHITLIHEATVIPPTALPPAQLDANFLLNLDGHDDANDEQQYCDSDDDDGNTSFTPEYCLKKKEKRGSACGHYVLIFSIMVPSFDSEDVTRHDVIKIGQSTS